MRTEGLVFLLVAALAGTVSAEEEPGAATFKILGFTFCFAEEGKDEDCRALRPEEAKARPGDDLEVIVPDIDALRLDDVVERLRARGVEARVVVVDGELVEEGTPLPVEWRDARVRTSEGSVTLARRSGDIAVVVFGRPSSSLRAMQHRVARAVSGG